MLSKSNVFASFSSNDLKAAKEFYTTKLGLEVLEFQEEGMLVLKAGDTKFMVYHKPNHTPAIFTVLNFEVDDIKQSVSELKEKGVKFEIYEGFNQDENGIAEMGGPLMAWFLDPAGNIISIINK